MMLSHSPLSFQPERLQLLQTMPIARKLTSCEPPYEARLHKLLEANPALFGDDWIWIGSQIRTQAGKIIDLVAIDAWGRVFGVNVHRRVDGPTALCDSLPSLAWLENLQPDDIDNMCAIYRGADLQTVLARRCDTPPSREFINAETGFVIVVSDAQRARPATQMLHDRGANLWMMEFACFGDPRAPTLVFTAIVGL